MIAVRKLALSALAVLTLASCAFGEGSENSGSVKGTLEGKGFTVSVMSAADYNASVTAKIFTEAKNLKDYLVAGKVETKEVFTVWFFENIKTADAWFNENLSKISGIYSGEENLCTGLRNNAVFVGNTSVRDMLNWGVSAI